MTAAIQPFEVPELTLDDATTLPKLGFGTYALRGYDGADSVASALRLGYRFVDTAYNYENEGAVGEGIRRSGVAREELRVESKLPGRYQRHDDAVHAVEESLLRASLEYFDLYIIHWPNPKQDHYVEAWQTLIELRDRGLLRSIGVSNFLPEHIERIVHETGVIPSVNQIEVHPRFPQEEAIAWNAEHGIVTEAWTPVGRGSDLRDDPTIAAIAQTHGRTPTQVILRWHVQRGTVPIPKAASPAHQRENLETFDFELSADEIATITALGRPDGRINDQDPAVYEEF